ncbi:MAG: hypothetical protein ACK4GW_08480 [Pseudorhodobacter sp.]
MDDAPINIETIEDSALLRAWQYRGQSRRLVLCFSGLGKDQSQVPGYEFASISTGGGEDNVLYFADPNRSWLNEPGLIDQIVAVTEVKKARWQIDEVVTMGHSMGGFMACVIPHFTPIDVALALSPQVSIHPEVVPDDPRWMTHREAIDNIDISDVGSYLTARTQYVVIYGRHGREAPQRDRFPNPDNLHLYVMPQTNHNTAARLKSLGLLADLRDLAFDRNFSALHDLMSEGARAALVETPVVEDLAEGLK